MTEKLEIPVWDSAYRVISSSFPPITLFEDILDPAELQMSYALESLTNDRLAEEVGLISRVAPEDRVSGHGSTPVMAAFTHIGKVSRFTDGTFGIYYAASSQSAAIAAAGEENALIARKQGVWQGYLTCEKAEKGREISDRIGAKGSAKKGQKRRELALTRNTPCLAHHEKAQPFQIGLSH